MDGIDLQQYGRAMQKLDDFIPLVEKHIVASDLRHQDNEKRIGVIEEDKRFWKRLLIIGAIFWPIAVPLLQKFILRLFGFQGDSLADILSFSLPFIDIL